MEALAKSDGIPVVGDFETIRDVFYWTVESHLVVYHRLERTKIIRIIAIKPA
jgi:hypothetical protein